MEKTNMHENIFTFVINGIINGERVSRQIILLILKY